MRMPGLMTVLGVFLAVLGAEYLHRRRIRVVELLAFGPTGGARPWTLLVPWLRATSLAACAWGLVTLLVLAGKPTASDADLRHRGEATRLVFVLDLSPSMHLQDAGSDGKQTRKERMRDVVDSVLSRVSGNLKFGAIGFYTDALPVVMEARDPELVRNVTHDLPLTYAMPLGKTDLGKAINASVKLVSDLPEASTRLVVVTDGDTVIPGSVQPRPRSVADVLVLGVGNPNKGTYIDGHQSKQEKDMLRLMASSLGGAYVDVNEKHLPTTLLGDLVVQTPPAGRGVGLSTLSVWSIVVGASVYALMPMLLAWQGTDWVVPDARQSATGRQNGDARR
jgi:Ca-activated chloride channel family protein